MRKFNNRANLLKMVRKYVAETATPEERKFLETYYEYFEKKEDLFYELSEEDRQRFEIEVQDVILSSEGTKEPSNSPLWFYFNRIAAAASIIFILSAGLYFYWKRPVQELVITKPKQVKQDIAPGGNKAVLTLGDGSKIILDDAINGEIAVQAGITISKQADGQLIYKVAASDAGNKSLLNVFNTIETPMGGEYQIILPDGSRVWLNSASLLRFPASFGGKERRVKLNGEAYFEVTTNKKMPFFVESDLQEVQVFGTHFNINSYQDEAAVRTTLLEGVVKVSIPNSTTSYVLKPGEETSVKLSDGTLSVKNANVEESIAWKNGYFIFNGDNIESIMRKISRWYNVDVEYAGNIPTGGFGGNVSKSKNISEVLRILELTQEVNFKVEGRRVIVMP